MHSLCLYCKLVSYRLNMVLVSLPIVNTNMLVFFSIMQVEKKKPKSCVSLIICNNCCSDVDRESE